MCFLLSLFCSEVQIPIWHEWENEENYFTRLKVMRNNDILNINIKADGSSPLLIIPNM